MILLRNPPLRYFSCFKFIEYNLKAELKYFVRFYTANISAKHASHRAAFRTAIDRAVNATDITSLKSHKSTYKSVFSSDSTALRSPYLEAHITTIVATKRTTVYTPIRATVEKAFSPAFWTTVHNAFCSTERSAYIKTLRSPFDGAYTATIDCTDKTTFSDSFAATIESTIKPTFLVSQQSPDCDAQEATKLPTFRSSFTPTY